MKRLALLLYLFLTATFSLSSQESRSSGASDIDVYLLTCGPGTDVYAAWGHTALRVIDKSLGTDIVYNWGVFDFSTKNFAWKFAKGRLEYMLAYEPFDDFMMTYIYQNRWVKSQKINLETEEVYEMMRLIGENLRPENVKYRYDFFYDDCSTRVRDLMEDVLGDILLYPPYELEEGTTFSYEVGRYTANYAWLDLGIDLLMGMPGFRSTSMRDRMFLPDGLSEGLAQLEVNRQGRMIPLLANPVMLLESDSQPVSQKMVYSPLFVFSLLLLIVLVLTVWVKSRTVNNIIDLTIFFIFSILAVLMIFFNFFTDHDQMNWNINILWLSPFVIVSLFGLILNKEFTGWFRAVFVFSLLFATAITFFPGALNQAFLPLTLILALRSFLRSQYEWNPLKINPI